MSEIAMPRLSATTAEGVIVAWRKRVGDRVARGEPLVAIRTDRAVLVVACTESGVLHRILAQPGTTVPVGAPIAVIHDGSATVDSAHRTELEQPVAGPPPADDRFRAWPLARRLARDLGVNLATVNGSGPGGRVTRDDVLAAAHKSAQPAEPPAGALVEEAEGTATPPESRTPDEPASVAGTDREMPLTRFRRVIARRLAESVRVVPQLSVTRTVDVGELVAFCTSLNARLAGAGGAGPVSVNALVLKACASALRAHPEVNVSVVGGEILAHQRIHLGMAVALETGLVVPVIRDADRKSLTEIAAEAGDLAARARQGALTAAEQTGSTFTVADFGPLDVDSCTAVVSPPEAAVLAVGAVRQIPVVRDGALAVGQTMTLALSVDHRALDGALAAGFVRSLAALLADPLRIVA